MQSSRVKLIGLAAESARALARGEAPSFVDALVTERSVGSKSEIQFLELSVCVVLSTNNRIGGLLNIPISERACARKSGL